LLSAALLILSVIAISDPSSAGPRYGIDFAGGTLIQVKFSKRRLPISTTIKTGMVSRRYQQTAMLGPNLW
jgi:preprotein translocase subunit SecF